MKIKPDSLILSLDTSSKQSSVCLCRDKKIVGHKILESPGSLSEILVFEIDTLLKENNVSPADLDLVVLIDGPGSFTGLRIGMAAVKGLVLPFNIPVKTVSALDAAAHELFSSEKNAEKICIVINAYMGDVFYCIYRRGSDGSPFIVEGPGVRNSGTFFNDLPEKTLLAGPDLVFFREKYSFSERDSITSLPPLAAAAAAEGVRKFNSEGADDIDMLVPRYMKKSAAEIRRGE
ncbi:MAG: tRNA (adenosine(37)-N6)-threonylcarbamoyltransferase complex dimerization subunit type 1 TsaB [Fibrobacterota bacterium]